MCEDSQGRPANMLLFQIQMGVLTSNFKIIIKITRPPVQRMYTTLDNGIIIIHTLKFKIFILWPLSTK